MKIQKIGISLGETRERKTTSGAMVYHKAHFDIQVEADEDDFPMNVAGEYEAFRKKVSDLARAGLQTEMDRFNSLDKYKKK